jgi:predicted RNA-binding Zn-ribbon protein involved in translation (DUF1610 family)
MAKSDFICDNCGRVKGSDWAGNSTEKYKCKKCGWICYGCVTSAGFFSSKYECTECGKEVLPYEYSERRRRWEKA